MLDITNLTAPLKATDTKHRELSWFAERVERAKIKPFSEIVPVTPAIARRLLEVNDGNRPLNGNLIAEICADIQIGYWSLNGEAIIVSRDGLLNDGQHRLEAICRTGETCESVVTFGVPRDSRMTVDMGRQRTAGNFLAMAGATYSNNSASVSKLLIEHRKGIFVRGGGKKSVSLTKQDVRAFYGQNRKAIQNALAAVVNEKFSRIIGITSLAAAHVILTRANSTEAEVFFHRLLSGANLKETDPILWLRSRAVNERSNHLRPAEKLELILAHWNRWRKGDKMRQHYRRQGEFPVVVK